MLLMRYWNVINYFLLFTGLLASIGFALPLSLIEEIKSNELSKETPNNINSKNINNKVKRAHPILNNNPEHVMSRDGGGDNVHQSYFTDNKPSAIKRGGGGANMMKNWSPPDGASLLPQGFYQNPNNNNIRLSTLYNNNDNNNNNIVDDDAADNDDEAMMFNNNDDKTIAEYEKGFNYGTNKEKLDEALQNAVLKSELYGDPGAINQYRYYGAAAAVDERRRKRRGTATTPYKKIRPENDNRMKREVNLTPEEILTILTLYENERQNNYRPSSSSWQHQRLDHPSNNYPDNNINDDNNNNMMINDDFEPPQQQQQSNDESWMDSPVYPHATTTTDDDEMDSSNYLYDTSAGDKRLATGNINGRRYNNMMSPFSSNNNYDNNRNKMKRYMVAARKRSPSSAGRSNNIMDPTRELRYLNGPNQNDFYTLSQLLSNQREPNVPLYHRLVL